MTVNMKLWNQLEMTDPQFTKSFRRSGGFSGTDINPTWRMKRLTETFGPAGVGWWYNIREHWSEEVDGKRFAFVLLEFYYWVQHEDGGDRSEPILQIGGTEFGRAPDEAYKMAVTDALGKCAAALGLAADVYLGQFDDSKYQRQAAEHYAGQALEVVKEKLAQCKSLAEVDEASKWVGSQNPPTSLRPAIRQLFEQARAAIGNGKDAA